MTMVMTIYQAARSATETFVYPLPYIGRREVPPGNFEACITISRDISCSVWDQQQQICKILKNHQKHWGIMQPCKMCSFWTSRQTTPLRNAGRLGPPQSMRILSLRGLLGSALGDHGGNCHTADRRKHTPAAIPTTRCPALGVSLWALTVL